MRNGWNGVGIVNGSQEVLDRDVPALVGLDAVLDVGASPTLRRLCPVMVRMEALGSRWRTDVVEFMVADHDAAGEAMVQESMAGRVVFIGTPGPRTLAALFTLQEGGRWANVVPTPEPGRPVRVLWRGLEGHVVEAAPSWEAVRLPESTEAQVAPEPTEAPGGPQEAQEDSQGVHGPVDPPMDQEDPSMAPGDTSTDGGE